MEWSAKIVKHKEESRIAVYFEKRKEYIDRIKKLPDARWSYTLNAWHLPITESNLKQFALSNTLLHEEKQERIQKFSL